MATTKITIRIEERLLHAFSEKLEASFLKRDAFLHHMIRDQLPHLKRDMEGLRVSPEAKRHISRKFGEMITVPVSIVVDSGTADELRELVRKHNIVRDAFLNRLILFLIGPNQLFDILDIPTSVDDESLRNLGSMPVSPLASIHESVGDPFFYIREFLAEYGREPIYRTVLVPSLEGFSCYMPNEEVPGTAEYAKNERVSRALFNTLFNDVR